MSKLTAERILKVEAEKWAAKPYSQICSHHVNDTDCYEVQAANEIYDILVRWIDICDDSVRIYIEIGGPGLDWSFTFPSRDLVFHKDGRVETF
ncbi:DUF3843 family protein [bacterium]|nr:DUF3843 family protein [bacterium]